jgi:acyl-CoA synthetase
VILREGERVSGDAMLDHLHAVGLSKYDMPEFFLAMDAFPLTASGKILKRELQEWVKSGRIAPQPVRWREPAKET